MQLPNISHAEQTPLPSKTTNSFLIRPSFRISETATVYPDRSAGFAEVAYNPDDNEYLVVWETDGLTELSGVKDVYGQRVSAGTNARIENVFRISNLTDADKNNGSNRPKIVYNRTAREYLVVWHGSGLFDSPDKFFEIYGRRLSRIGKPIGISFRISYDTDLGKVSTSFVRGGSQADVAWNPANNEYLVVWKGMGEPEDVVKMEIYGQRLKSTGERLGKSFRISHTSDQGINFHANAPAVAYSSKDNQYLVVWSGGFKIESQLEVWGKGLSAAGEVLNSKNEFRISQSAAVEGNRGTSSPRVIYDNAHNEYLVVFQANALRNSESVNEIFGQRIDAATLGETGPNDFRISNTVGGVSSSRPSVTSNSVTKEYLVIWRTTRPNAPSEIFGRRLTTAGAEIEAEFQISNITAVGKDRTVSNPTLTHNTQNGEYLVVWQGNGLSGPNSERVIEIFGQKLELARAPR